MSKLIDVVSSSMALSANSRDKEGSPLDVDGKNKEKDLYSKYENMIEILRSYLVLAENPIDLGDETLRPHLFAKLSYGLRKSGEFFGMAKYWQRMAYAERKRAEAVAALDEFGKYLAAKKSMGEDVKGSEAMRAHYVNTDSNVLTAINKEAMVDAMVEQLSTMKMEFTMAISTIKAMIYGSRDSDFMSGASVSVNTKE